MARSAMSATVIEVDRGAKRLFNLARELSKKDAYAKVGVLDNGGAGSQMRGRLTQAMIALVLEYGARFIPARPFVRATFDRVRGELEAMSVILVRKIYEGTMTVERALGLMATKLASEIRKTITTGQEVPPPNAPSTLKKKQKLTRKGARGKVRTLFDTGRMAASITYALVFKGK